MLAKPADGPADRHSGFCLWKTPETSSRQKKVKKEKQPLGAAFISWCSEF